VWKPGDVAGRVSRHTVFHRARPVSREEFRTFMLSQSRRVPETIAVARDLARRALPDDEYQQRSAELNADRLHVFGLRDIFDRLSRAGWASQALAQIYERAL